MAELAAMKHGCVILGQDVDDSRNGARLREIEGLKAALRDAAGYQKRERWIGHGHVGGIARFSGDLQSGIVTRRRRAHVLLRLRCSSIHRHISMTAACASARLSVRLPSSILKPLCSRACAPKNAACAAAS